MTAPCADDLFRDVVEHADLIELRLELGDELLMRGVWQIGFKPGLVGKGHEETMREAVVQAFRADVGAPFEGFHRVDLLGQLDEVFLKSLHLLCRGTVLELEEHNMAVRGVGGEGGGGHGENEGKNGKQDGFHKGESGKGGVIVNGGERVGKLVLLPHLVHKLLHQIHRLRDEISAVA